MFFAKSPCAPAWRSDSSALGWQRVRPHEASCQERPPAAASGERQPLDSSMRPGKGPPSAEPVGGWVSKRGEQRGEQRGQDERNGTLLYLSPCLHISFHGARREPVDASFLSTR